MKHFAKIPIMKKILKGFALAINMLSIFPFFKIHDFFKGINGYAVMFYPLVGLLIGYLLSISFLALSSIFPALHVSIIILALWVLFTGALHLDGFSDTVDGLFVSKNRSFAVMKDPNIGAMGMIFTLIFILLKGSALLHVSEWSELALILMLARYNSVLAIYFYPYLSKNGMASLAKEEFTSTQLIITTILVLGVVFFTCKGWILLAVSLISFFIMKLFFIKRYGGFTGDIYGFVIELTELILLHVIILKF